jgi:hypothetical protein
MYYAVARRLSFDYGVGEGVYCVYYRAVRDCAGLLQHAQSQRGARHAERMDRPRLRESHWPQPCLDPRPSSLGTWHHGNPGLRRGSAGQRSPLTQPALRFVLSKPNISCALVGLAEPAHLEEALAGVEKGPLPKEAIKQLDQLYEKKNSGILA